MARCAERWAASFWYGPATYLGQQVWRDALLMVVIMGPGKILSGRPCLPCNGSSGILCCCDLLLRPAVVIRWRILLHLSWQLCMCSVRSSVQQRNILQQPCNSTSPVHAGFLLVTREVPLAAAMGSLLLVACQGLQPTPLAEERERQLGCLGPSR